ncbi:MAG: hypothetical protein ACI4ET_05195 [Bilifractor sp.]
MIVYRLADLTVGVEGAGSYTRDLMKDYENKEPIRGLPQIRITLTPEMVRRERELEGDGFSADYLESIAVYRAFCEQALAFDVFFFHASAVAKDGEAYLFSGPSGVGKSTHAAMWRKTFGSSVIMVNDDKPLIRFRGRKAYVYGTPWDGKQHLNTNICLPVRAVCFLAKGEENRIRKLSYQEALKLTESQTFHAASWEHRKRNEMLSSMLLNMVPVYSLCCDISERAAVTAYEAMRK